MGIVDLKTRLHDVPGIETLTMIMQGGRQNYSLNGRTISLDAAASDADVETAIRAAIAKQEMFAGLTGQPSARPAFGREHYAAFAKRTGSHACSNDRPSSNGRPHRQASP